MNIYLFFWYKLEYSLVGMSKRVSPPCRWPTHPRPPVFENGVQKYTQARAPAGGPKAGPTRLNPSNFFKKMIFSHFFILKKKWLTGARQLPRAQKNHPHLPKNGELAGRA